MVRLGKRGAAEEFSILLIGELILAAFVFLALLVYVRDVAGNYRFEQNFLARDIALVVDSAYAAPGNLEVSYDTARKEHNTILFGPQPLFRYAFDDSRVNVLSEQVLFNDLSKGTYYFGTDKNINLNKPEPFSGSVDLKKEGNDITIQEEKQVSNG